MEEGAVKVAEDDPNEKGGGRGLKLAQREGEEDSNGRKAKGECGLRIAERNQGKK